MQITKSQITPTGYYLTLLSDDRTTRVDGQVQHNGDKALEKKLVQEAKDLMNKALHIGVEGIENEQAGKSYKPQH